MINLVRRIVRHARLPATRATNESGDPHVLEKHVLAAPSPANAVDLFRGLWVSRLPPPLDALAAGTAELFQDPRLAWALDTLGSIKGARVLELGPLEGGHSFMLDRRGASEVVAIEGNSAAYLRCVVVKELVGMPSVHFQLGDFTAFLRDTSDRFDLCVASGVLYHMVNPVEVIHQISLLAPRVAIWTHYYDDKVFGAASKTAGRLVEPVWKEHRGFRHRLYRHEYGAALGLMNFSGGNRPYSYWLTRDDLLAALRHFGFTRIETAFEQPEHLHGPAFTVAAWK